MKTCLFQEIQLEVYFPLPLHLDTETEKPTGTFGEKKTQNQNTENLVLKTNDSPNIIENVSPRHWFPPSALLRSSFCRLTNIGC